MTRAVRIRLAVFVALAALGIMYVGASYFGIVDRVLGRESSVAVDLPASGGLYVGSEVDYLGVQVGKVTGMQLTRSGVRVTLQLQPGIRIPSDATVKVANLSAVGEQYVDFLPPTSPTGSADDSYLGDGDTVTAGQEALPIPTQDLLSRLDGFAGSVNTDDLRTVVSELGTMFHGNAENLRRLLTDGTGLVQQASEHERQTISLLDSGREVLRTQQAHSGDIRVFARGLSQLTGTLRASDPQLRTILQGGSTTIRQVRSLVDGLSPVMPQFISNLVTTNQVFTARLPALEQTLVTFPLVASNGFIGTPGDGYGHLNMQYTYTAGACMKGYEPTSKWLPGTDTSDPPTYPAKCTDPRAQPGYDGSDGMLERGVNEVPPVAGTDALAVAGYDPATDRADVGGGRTVTMTKSNGGLISLLSGNDWERILVGPVSDE